ncbi:achaete-scute-like protein 1 [Plakobranchus ocellatus]|uniref:Achaete-scute-like protein 1 n=1 Tax=Plakobranchus ocellatus TaxID=259542 RepID=A0AAV4DEU0_9GAST|nr:achaete-scute-like protein 1 [Plakobranchus ocellatus]
MASYGGCPSMQLEPMFNHNFGTFVDTHNSMACTYDYLYVQESPNNCAAYCESPDNMPSCLYAPSRNTPMCASPCMMTPLSPYLSVSPASSEIQSKENYRSMREVDAGSPPCRRRLNFSGGVSPLDISDEAPVAVAKRNERERNRVKLINMTFQKLRQHLPMMTVGSKGKSRKLSKVQTLRSAIDYIRELQHKVHKHQQESLSQQQPQPKQELHQKTHKQLQDEFLQMKPYSPNSEEDDMAGEEEMFEDGEMTYETFPPLQHRNSKCNISYGNYNNIMNSSNISSSSNSNRVNDTNNNLSGGSTGCGAGSDQCMSILSFGDEIKFAAEDEHFTSVNTCG